MEEKTIIDNSFLNSSLSNWKLRHQFYQTNRNFQQLQNRIAILSLQKHKKLKDIENKLNHHKKFVQTKIYKHQLKQAIQKKNSIQARQSSSNSRIFQSIRQNRSIQIRRQQQELRQSKHKVFEQTRNERIQNEKRVMLNKFQQLQQKIKKRNKVRLIQIQCKQNIQTYWNTRLQSYEQQKKMQMGRRLKMQEQEMKRLEEIEENERSLLQEIRKAEEMERELERLIVEEKGMDGGKLVGVYGGKAMGEGEE